MTTLNFDITKFLEAERPKYDVKMFGDPHRMAMKIVNDDEFQSVHNYQVVGRSAQGAENWKTIRYTNEDATSVGNKGTIYTN